jgi:hypothetical protein
MKSDFRYMDAEQGEFDSCFNTADSITAIRVEERKREDADESDHITGSGREPQ